MIRKSLVAAIGLTGLAAAPAMANTTINSSPAYACGFGVCHQTFDTGSQPTDWKSSQGNLEIFNLNLFDTSLGTLTSVTFTTTGASAISAGSLTNTSATSQTFDFTQDTKFTATAGLNAALNTALAGLALDPTYDTGTITLASGGSFTIPPNTHSATSVLTGPLSTFSQAGGGTQGLAFATKTTDSLSGGGGLIAFNITTNAEATLAVTYTYSPPVIRVPEPITAALFGTALLGLGFVRRRFG